MNRDQVEHIEKVLNRLYLIGVANLLLLTISGALMALWFDWSALPIMFLVGIFGGIQYVKWGNRQIDKAFEDISQTRPSAHQSPTTELQPGPAPSTVDPPIDE